MSATSESTLSDIFQKLKIDKVHPKEALMLDAQSYLRKNNAEFYSLGFDDNPKPTEYVCDSSSNKIYVEYSLDINKFNVNSDYEMQDWPGIIRKLSVKIEENSNKFAQLDCMIRNIPVEEIKNCDIKLILQCLLCNIECRQSFIRNECVVRMTKEAPLAFLGVVIPALQHTKKCIIEASVETAVICHLFTELCWEAGLKNIFLVLPKQGVPWLQTDLTFLDFDSTQGFTMGCMGVVTDRCDVDSAFNAFIYSTRRAPWKLQKVLVQESVYERFKDIATWKEKLTSSNVNATDMSEVTSQCSNSYICGDKLFLLDYVGNGLKEDNISSHIILVEAYRTTKELLSLLSKSSCFCLSLWSSDVAQANEIAYNVDSNLVWINDIGVFEGPAKASKAFYSKIIRGLNKVINENKCSKDMIKVLDSWTVSELQSRRKIFNNIIDRVNRSHFDKEELAFFDKLRRNINLVNNSSVEIIQNRLCVTLECPVGFITAGVNSEEEINDIFVSMLFGNGFITRDNHKLLSPFMRSGLPIFVTDLSELFPIIDGIFLYSNRCIWTNFGTIFAN